MRKFDTGNIVKIDNSKSYIMDILTNKKVLD